MLVILCDGSSLGNLGPSRIGVAIWKRISGTHSARRVNPSHTISKDIGVATNNDAEWQAVLEGVKYAMCVAKQGEDVFLYSDSLLVVSQANDEWKVKKPTMKQYKDQYDRLCMNMKFRGKLMWLPRQLTYLADKLT